MASSLGAHDTCVAQKCVGPPHRCNACGRRYSGHIPNGQWTYGKAKTGGISYNELMGPQTSKPSIAQRRAASPRKDQLSPEKFLSQKP